jgi:hypothetical protein
MYRAAAAAHRPSIAFPAAGIGRIRHDCWTYWGHSGAPLFDRTGSIVALHNSWDDSNGCR